jgi:putative heme-binding domain-containing protein
VEALNDANLWRRTTALRLLYERKDPATGQVLNASWAKAVGNDSRPEGRIALLYALRTAGALKAPELIAALGDSHPRVRCHALILSESMLDSSSTLLAKVSSLGNDPDPVVQFQLALSLGESNDAKANQGISDLLIRNADQRDIVDAALTSIGNRAGPVLQLLLANGNWLNSANSSRVLAAIVGQIVRQRNEGDLAILLDALAAPGVNNRAVVAALLKALSKVPADALAAANSSQLAELRRLRSTASDSLVKGARKVLDEDSGPVNARVVAIENLAFGTFDEAEPLFEQLLSPQEPAAVHAAILATCAEFDSPKVAELVIAHWDGFSPAERLKATELLLRRPPWALALLNYLQSENVGIATLDPGHIARLDNYPDDTVQKLARSLRGKHIAADRQQVFNEYRGVALAGGDASKGKAVFEKNCATCHKLNGLGNEIGPNLAAMISRGAESVLFNILAPNGEVDPRYLEYSVITADGQVLSGVIAGETSTAVTLRSADNKLSTVLLVDVEERHNTGKSLMPEGFEKLIDKAAMADLLSYLQQAAAAEGAKK